MGRRPILLIGGLTLFLCLLCTLPLTNSCAGDTSSFELGNELLRDGNYTGAVEAFRAFVGENPDHRLVPAANWTMANILLTVDGNHEKGQELFRKILEENPDTDWETFGYYRLSESYEEQEDWSKAAEVYETALEKLSGSADPLMQQRVEGLRRRLVSCYQHVVDNERAVEVYTRLIQQNPAAPSAASDQYSLAQLYLEADDPRSAAENFAMLVERYPSSSHAQRVRSEQAELLAEQLEYDWTPFTSYQSALELGRTGDHEEALARLDQIVESNPDSPMTHAIAFQKRFIEYQRSGDAAALQEHLTSAADEYPYGLGGLDGGQLGYFLGMIVEAQEELASEPPDAGGSYLRMGIGYLQTQAPQCGIDSLTKGIELSPETPNLYNILGYCNLSCERYDDAISAFQQLIDVAPEDPNSYDSMGEGHLSRGDTATAIEFYKRSLSIDSTFSNPYYMLGTIYHGLGEYGPAVEYFEAYMEIDPTGYRAQEIEHRLQEMGSSTTETTEEER